MTYFFLVFSYVSKKSIVFFSAFLDCFNIFQLFVRFVFLAEEKDLSGTFKTLKSLPWLKKILSDKQMS